MEGVFWGKDSSRKGAHLLQGSQLPVPAVPVLVLTTDITLTRRAHAENRAWQQPRLFRSDCKRSLSGDFIRISLKIEQNSCLFLDIFSSAEWFVHDFYIQAQGGCQMCLSAVELDHSGQLFWDTSSWLSAWVSVFWAWRMDLNIGVQTLFVYCEKLI